MEMAPIGRSRERGGERHPQPHTLAQVNLKPKIEIKYINIIHTTYNMHTYIRGITYRVLRMYVKQQVGCREGDKAKSAP